MADDKLAELLKTQISLTEWLENIKHSDTATIRKEDNEKRERLRVLNELIGLPFDKPTQFKAIELTEDNQAFANFLRERGDELCALRLMPIEGDLPKLRMRGKTIRDAFAWYKEQTIDPTKYRADFVPHPPDHTWATIFVVNEHGIQGEIIYGCHSQLTQGFIDEGSEPIAFRFDFKSWSTKPKNPDAEVYLKKLVEYIHVPVKSDQAKLTKALGASFINDYIEGYWESADSSMGVWFIDYSQAFGKMLKDLVVRTDSGTDAIVTGQTGSTGTATGPVKIVRPDQLDTPFPDGAILVCNVTTPEYVPLMQKAAAIVTDQGGILSHAAIVSRELKVPCVVGTGNATSKLKNGQVVIVDATNGTVTLG